MHNYKVLHLTRTRTLWLRSLEWVCNPSQCIHTVLHSFQLSVFESFLINFVFISLTSSLSLCHSLARSFSLSHPCDRPDARGFVFETFFSCFLTSIAFFTLERYNFWDSLHQIFSPLSLCYCWKFQLHFVQRTRFFVSLKMKTNATVIIGMWF